MKLVSVLLLLLGTCQALYEASSPVVKLTKDNFKKLVMDSNELWFVEFYAPWCGHCKQLAPSWEKAAKNLKGVVKVGAVDMTTDQEVGAPYNVQGFPTIKFFGFDKQKPQDYQGQRDTETIVNYALEKIPSEVKKRMKGKDESKKKSEGKSKSKEPVTDKDVTVLDASNFDELVLKSKDIWMVEFYAPWCGHCKKLEPEWNEAATKLKGSVKLGKVDATVETALAGRYGVQGYPSIKVFDYGEGKSDSKSYDYPQDRTAQAIIQFGMELAEKADIEPEVHELYQQKIYDDHCKGQTICVLSFLPNIYDSNAKERLQYLEVIKKVAKKNRKHPFEFFWLSAGDQLDFERDLNLGFGFPAVVAISNSKQKVATMKGAYDGENVNSFLNGLISGGVSLDDLKKKVAVKKADQWDGQDAKPIEEEYYDDL